MASKSSNFENLTHVFGKSVPVWEADSLKSHLKKLIGEEKVQKTYLEKLAKINKLTYFI